MKKKVNVSIDLSTKEGTVSYVIVGHRTEISTYCKKGTPVDEAKKNILELVRQAKDCPSRRKIEADIMSKKTVDEIQFYMWNLLMAGMDSSLKVIK